jgi:hypothetical protein
MKHLFSGIAAAALAIGSANAADIPAPVYKAPAAAVAHNGLYFWVDGSSQSIHLPSYTLGVHNTQASAAGGADLGPAQAFNPRATGFGTRGAIGYVLPGGPLSPAFGTNVRIELGVSYVHATRSQSGVADGAFSDSVLLNGATNAIAFGCLPGGAVTCSVASALSTNYRSWQINGTIASDYKMGQVTLTPSVAVIGGNARNQQGLAQTVRQLNPGLLNTANYTADTTLKWTDIGARFGLTGTMDLTTWLAASLGGYVGGVGRSVSFNGSDVLVSTLLVPGASTVAGNASTTALVANAEAGLAVKVMQATTLRGFVGLNYDGNVPGISAPSYTGNRFPAATSTTPAGIFFSSQTSYYAGGGVMVKF